MRYIFGKIELEGLGVIDLAELKLTTNRIFSVFHSDACSKSDLIDLVPLSVLYFLELNLKTARHLMRLDNGMPPVLNLTNPCWKLYPRFMQSM